MQRLSDYRDRQRFIFGVWICLATICYVVVDAGAARTLATYGNSRIADELLLWAFPIPVAFVLGYRAANQSDRTSAVERWPSLVSAIAAAAGQLLGYVGTLPIAPLPEPLVVGVGTAVTAIFVGFGATLGTQLAHLSNGDVTIDWRLAAVVSGILLLASLLEFTYYQQIFTGVFFLVFGSYWTVATWIVRQ